MRAYIAMSNPKAGVWGTEVNNETYLARTIYEPEPLTVKTGLLDASGTPIYRVEKMGPIGFTHFKDR